MGKSASIGGGLSTFGGRPCRTAEHGPRVLARTASVWTPTGAVCWVQTADTRTHTGRDDAPEGAVVRVREGGEVLDRVEHDRAIFAAMLGGQDGATLFLLAAEWRGVEHVDEAVAGRTGQVLLTKAPSRGAGWP